MPLSTHTKRGFWNPFLVAPGMRLLAQTTPLERDFLSLISPPSTPLLVQNAEASFKVLGAVPDIMNKVQLFQDQILPHGEPLGLGTAGAPSPVEAPCKARSK